MDAVYRQARAVLERAAAATGKDDKTAQISLLVELCAHRGDAALVEEMVAGVCAFAPDRSNAVRSAVVKFVEAVVARSGRATAQAAEAAFQSLAVLALDEEDKVAVPFAARICRRRGAAAPRPPRG